MPSVIRRGIHPFLLASAMMVMLGCFSSPAAASFGVQPFYPSQEEDRTTATGDVNGDGYIDLATGGDSGNVTIRLNDGEGSFGPAHSLLAEVAIRSIAIGQFVGDGSSDLAVGSSYTFLVFEGDGSGTFGPVPEIQQGTPAKSFAAGDLNGDGNPDFAAVDEQVEVLLGNGDGTFSTLAGFPAGDRPASVAISDLDGDTKLDLAVANAGSHDVSILLGKGDGTFRSAVSYPLENNHVVKNFFDDADMSLAVDDFDRDGAKDLAVSDSFAEGISVFRGDGTGSFGKITQLGGVSFPTSMTAADFNSDSYVDIAASEYENGVKILAGYGAGRFRLISTLSAGSTLLGISSAQLNQDALPDLAATRYYDGGVTVLLNRGPAARLGRIGVGAPPGVKRSRPLTYRIAIPSAGDIALQRVKLKVSGRGIRSRVLSLGALPAGTVKRLKVKVRPRLKGYLRARFRATAANAKGSSAKEVTWVYG